MTRIKLQKHTKYHISLPKQIVDEIAHWQKGMELEVEWIEKGKNTVIDKPYFRISKPDNLWSKKIKVE